MLLPARPLRLDPSFASNHRNGGFLLALFGLAAIVANGWWQFEKAMTVRAEMKVWQDGVIAERSAVEGEATASNFTFHDYNLLVTYFDGRHKKYEQRVKFDTIFATVDPGAPPMVRYLSSDPYRFALSWAMDVTGGRWRMIGIATLFGFVMGGGLICLGVFMMKAHATARRCAVQSVDLLARLTGIMPYNIKDKHAGYTYKYTGLGPDGQPVTGSVSFDLKHRPLFADAAQQTMVGVVDPEDRKRVVMLRDDFYPYSLTPGEQVDFKIASAQLDQQTRKSRSKSAGQ